MSRAAARLPCLDRTGPPGTHRGPREAETSACACNSSCCLLARPPACPSMPAVSGREIAKPCRIGRPGKAECCSAAARTGVSQRRRRALCVAAAGRATGLLHGITDFGRHPNHTMPRKRPNHNSQGLLMPPSAVVSAPPHRGVAAARAASSGLQRPPIGQLAHQA